MYFIHVIETICTQLSMMRVIKGVCTTLLWYCGRIKGQGCVFTNPKIGPLIGNSLFWEARDPIFKMVPKPQLKKIELNDWCRLRSGPSAGKNMIQNFGTIFAVTEVRKPPYVPLGQPLKLNGILVKHTPERETGARTEQGQFWEPQLTLHVSLLNESSEVIIFWAQLTHIPAVQSDYPSSVRVFLKMSWLSLGSCCESDRK